MRIRLLSRSRYLYSTRRLIQEARERGHDVDVVDPTHEGLAVGSLPDRLTEPPSRATTRRILASPGVIIGDEPPARTDSAEWSATTALRASYLGGISAEGLPMHTDGLALPDVVVPRIGQSITDYGLGVLRQYELCNIPTLNHSSAIAVARDKVHTLQALAAAGLAIPRTVVTRNLQDLDETVELLGGLPVVLKTFRGTQGVGVMRLDSIASLRSVLDMMQSIGQDVLLQRYVTEASGRDTRVIVVGDRVVAAMKRESKQQDEFRSNLHRGGQGERVALTDEDAEVARKAARAIGLNVAGVDLLETDEGTLVLEVNAAPGLEGVESVSEIDVAAEIIKEAERCAEAGTSLAER